MAKKHDDAAERIARRHNGRYKASKSPDVNTPTRRIEVKSKATEISKAVTQLGRGRRKRYVALPRSEHDAALPRLPSGIGLMDYNGKIRKRARRGLGGGATRWSVVF